MTAYVALLRAVNVGGTGKLPMTELRAMCERSGFANVGTYIASGNALFTTRLGEAKVKALLEAELEEYAGRHIPVLVRTAAEMRDVVARNPFPNADRKGTVAIFLDAPPPPDALDSIRGRVDEELRLGAREIYVDYRGRLGTSKLKIPVASSGTARNINTVAALAELAAAL
jgi:uncharacterized protein (DUF1697 family)